VSPHTNRFGDYLKARRAQLKPEDVGFPSDPARRISGLKREEVAQLAGISPEYYTRLEQGKSYRLSEQVLAGLTRALRLDSDAAAYFYRLALPEPPTTTTRSAPVLNEMVRQLAEQRSDVPIYIYDRNQDIILANDLARALFPILIPGANSVKATFEMVPEVRATQQWRELAQTVVAALRFHGEPADPRLQAIVGELSVREPLFRTLWADHDAVPLSTGVVPVQIEGIGIVDFPWQNLYVPGGLFMGVWPPPPGSLAQEVIHRFRRELQGRPSASELVTESGEVAGVEGIARSNLMNQELDPIGE
jgi:transcriptional regulator with XRE-family HTH domain